MLFAEPVWVLAAVPAARLPSRCSFESSNQALRNAMKVRSRRATGAPAKKPPAKIILCAGLKSSGSTWLYNVVIRLLKETRSGKTAAFYADEVALFPKGTELAHFLVVKSHVPSEPLLFVTRLTRGQIFLTVREPRDSVVSLMQRFSFPFEAALKDVAEEAARIVDFSRAQDVILLHYEDRFHEEQKTIAMVAALIGVRAPKALQQKIFKALTPDAVKRKIRNLKTQGVFGAAPKPEYFDPATHWHPGHVGDGRMGKYAEFLSAAQQDEVIAQTRDYCKRFGYLRARKR